MPAKTKEPKEENKKKKTSTTTKSTSTSKKNTSSKKTTTKKVVSTKSANKKETTKKTSSTKHTSKKSTSTKSSKTSTQKAVAKKATKKIKPIAEVVEYYDLPYRYNETIVKILYQTPNTLFVYWDISDEDREKFIKQYGENFFTITRPVLIIHNEDMNYSFEIPINDFANSWYLHINDSKCKYRIELGRRPNYYSEEATKEIQEKIISDYVYVSDSNEIELPNDKVLFNTNENNTIKFRNIKNSEEKSVALQEFIRNLPSIKKSSNNLPYLSEALLKNIYSEIYQNKDITLFDKITNPSSGSTSSRFK